MMQLLPASLMALGQFMLKAFICSGALYAYYRFFLKAKAFHQFNRFFLIGAVMISLALPFIQLPILPAAPSALTAVAHIVPALDRLDAFHEEQHLGATNYPFAAVTVIVLYTLVVSFLLVPIAGSLLKIRRLIRTGHCSKTDGYSLVLTNDPGAPFSFFHYIFWNAALDNSTVTGKKIMEHELVHVQQYHSAEKLLLEVVGAVCWINPFYRLISRDLAMVHEFIADAESLKADDSASLPELILSVSLPSAKFGIVHHFHSSSIQKRLNMLSSSNKKRKNLLQWLTLPLLVVLLAAFTLTHQTPGVGLTNSQPLIIVVDAGHGGEDPGAVSPAGVAEKDMTLSIVKKIQSLNTDPRLHIVLTRSTDEYQNPKDKVKLAAAQKPGLFLSIHLGKSGDNSGIEVYESARNETNRATSEAFAAVLINHLQGIYSTTPALHQRPDKGIWVLDAPDVSYPAILLECGNMDNAADMSFISDTHHQDDLARHILAALADFSQTTKK